MSDNLFNLAREITDEVLGEGTYADLNRGNPNPGVQAAIRESQPAHDRDDSEKNT